MTEQQAEHAVAVAASAIPIGAIMPFAGGMDADWLRQQGWLYCDGAALPKADYIELFLTIGTNFGGGRTEFNLPDMRGRFCRGVDMGAERDFYVSEREPSAPGGLAGSQPGSVLGDRTGWAEDHPLVAKEHEGHVHPVPHAPKDGNAYAIAGWKYGIWRAESTTTTEAGAHTHKVESGGDKESRPVNKNVFFIIKYADRDGQ